MNPTIEIKYLNNDGGGFAETCRLEPGTTVAQFLEKRDVSASQYKIRLRRRDEHGQVVSETPTGETPLQNGDFLSCVPLKAEGAGGCGRMWRECPPEANWDKQQARRDGAKVTRPKGVLLCVGSFLPPPLHGAGASLKQEPIKQKTGDHSLFRPTSGSGRASSSRERNTSGPGSPPSPSRSCLARAETRRRWRKPPCP